MQRLSLRAAVPAMLFALAAAGCGDTPGTTEVVPQGPASFVIVSGNNQTGAAGEELPQPLVVKATDASGNPVPGRHIGFAVVDGDGEMFVGGGVTDANGIVKDYWTLGTLAADSQRVEARSVDPATGAKQVFGVFRATSVPGAPTSTVPLTVPPPSGWSGPVRSLILDSMRVAIADRFGNRVMQSGVAVQWLASHGGNVTPTSGITTTDAQGVTRTLWRLGSQAGSQTLSTSVGGFPPKAMYSATATPGAPAIVQIVPDSLHARALGFVPFTITATDAYGNAVPFALESFNTSVVAVNTSGPAPRFQAVANGKAKVRAFTVNGKADSAVVTIQQEVASIAFRTMPATLKINATMPFNWYSVLRDANGYQVNGVTNAWTSTNPSVASVNAAGTATGLSQGTFQVVVSKDGVTVTSPVVTVVP